MYLGSGLHLNDSRSWIALARVSTSSIFAFFFLRPSFTSPSAFLFLWSESSFLVGSLVWTDFLDFLDCLGFFVILGSTTGAVSFSSFCFVSSTSLTCPASLACVSSFLFGTLFLGGSAGAPWPDLSCFVAKSLICWRLSSLLQVKQEKQLVILGWRCTCFELCFVELLRVWHWNSRMKISITWWGGRKDATVLAPKVLPKGSNRLSLRWTQV